jgi:hypothetical protein
MRDEMTSGETEQGTECRALVAIAPARSQPAERPMAGFVTQLIACERRIGPYRTARRAASSDAAASYAAAPGSQRAALQLVV